MMITIKVKQVEIIKKIMKQIMIMNVLKEMIVIIKE